MSYKTMLDLHTHSDNSPDGFHSVTLLCEYAAAAGLRAIALTDHCECNLYRCDSYDKAIRQSYFESLKAKSVFSGRLLVLSAIELGQPMQGPEEAKDALTAGKFDFVLTSLHNVTGKPDFYLIEFDEDENEPVRLMTKYYDEILEMVSTVDFDSLAHLTYPLRYITGEHGINVDMSRFRGILDEILLTLAKRGKAIEINTSGLRGKLQNTMPYPDLVRRFRELGGEYITVGSDAHRAEQVGANIEQGMDIAKAAGFSHITLFEQREPIQIKIE